MNYWTFAEAEHVQRFLDGLRTVMWLWAWEASVYAEGYVDGKWEGANEAR